MNGYTYEKRLGWINEKRVEPVVEAGGIAWFTKDGIIVMVPDQWEDQWGDVTGRGMAPLPEGVEFVRLPAEL